MVDWCIRMDDRESFWFVSAKQRKDTMPYQYAITTGTVQEPNKLLCNFHCSVKHFNIDPKSDGSYSMGIMQFSSIEEIVKYYQNNSLFVHEGQPVTLGQPVKPKTTTKYSQH